MCFNGWTKFSRRCAVTRMTRESLQARKARAGDMRWALLVRYEAQLVDEQYPADAQDRDQHVPMPRDHPTAAIAPRPQLCDPANDRPQLTPLRTSPKHPQYLQHHP